MISYPPSAARLQTAVGELLRLADVDSSERTVRCQLVYHPTKPSYTVWGQSTVREGLSAALVRVLNRPFAVSDNHWVVELNEAEALLTATSC